VFSEKIVAKREGLVVQANQNIEELASSVQECTLAGIGTGDGGPDGTTTPTSATFLGIATDCTLLELPAIGTIRFSSIFSIVAYTSP